MHSDPIRTEQLSRRNVFAKKGKIISNATINNTNKFSAELSLSFPRTPTQHPLSFFKMQGDKIIMLKSDYYNSQTEHSTIPGITITRGLRNKKPLKRGSERSVINHPVQKSFQRIV